MAPPSPVRISGAPVCPRCSKSVYAAEQVRTSKNRNEGQQRTHERAHPINPDLSPFRCTCQVVAPGGPYHKLCLKCKDCSKLLDSTNMTESAGDLYCKNCHARNFGPRGESFRGDVKQPNITKEPNEFNFFCKGYGYSSGAAFLSVDRPPSPTKSSPATPISPSSGETDSTLRPASPSKATITAKQIPGIGGASDTCPTCSKAVYFAEKVMGPGNVAYHKLCFKCSSCAKLLESGNCTESKNGVMCKACYGKEFGPKGYGFASGGAGVLSS